MAGWESDYRYEPSPLFEQVFYCLPFSKYKNPHCETGNKIIMPPSSLAQILDFQIKYPLIFKIESFNSDKISHCGVLEFDSEEGFVHVPEWMMKNLDLREGDPVILRNATLSRGVFMKLQPHTSSFAEVTNPKAVLEKRLRDFTCLSCGDTIRIKYGERDFYFDVLELSPGNAISLIDTDCIVDFAPPLDFKEPERDEQEFEKVDCGGDEHELEKVDRGRKGEEEGKLFRPFMGKAQRVDGVPVATVESGGCSALVGGRSKVVVEERKKSKKDGGKEEGKEKFKPFTGRSYVLGGR